MTAPVAAPALPPAVTPVEGAAAPGAAHERNFSEYLAEVHQTSLANSMGGRLANPAELAGQVASALRGFISRAEKCDNLFNGRSWRQGKPGEVKLASLSETGMEPQGGPAPSSFEASGGGSAQGLDAQGVNASGFDPGHRLDHVQGLLDAMDSMVEVQRFLAETSIMSGGTGAIDKAANTLLKGQ